jgi:lysophospholipase L1-like esterase
VALGTGFNQLNDCVPFCAAGHFHGYPVRIEMWRPRTIASILVFTRLTIFYTKGRPAGEPSHYTFTDSRLISGGYSWGPPTEQGYCVNTYGLTPEAACMNIHALPPATSPRPRYVALGDSYSSGEGNPPFAQPNSGCDRSVVDAWPELMAQHLGIGMQALLACSGATTEALTGSFKGMAPQLVSLSRIAPAPKLVTVTLGGNDLGFADVLTNCYLATCSTLLAGVEGSFAGGFGKHMAAVYRMIRRTVPHAQIVVVGYPQILPPSPITALHHCPWLKDPADPLLMRKITGQLDGVLSRAANTAGVRYVSTLNALKGHELCTADAWVKAIGLSGGNARGHPTARGQAALAAAVGRYVADHHLAR